MPPQHLCARAIRSQREAPNGSEDAECCRHPSYRELVTTGRLAVPLAPLIVVAGSVVSAWVGRRIWTGKMSILEEADRQWAEREEPRTEEP